MVIGLSGEQFREESATDLKLGAQLSLNCSPLSPITNLLGQ